MSIQSYRDLKVWQRAMELAELSYQITKEYPSEERYGLISQIRRSSTSVVANIAEGQGRSHVKEFLNHLSMAKGSLVELETLLLLSQRVGFLKEPQLAKAMEISAEVGRMITGLRHSLESRLI